MKKNLIILLLSALPVFSQTDSVISLYELKNQTIRSIENNDSYAEPVLFAESKNKKSAGQAILYSLLLPGMGELYAEAYDSGIYFTIADGVLWGTFIGMNVYGNWQQDRYISFAKSNAGISEDGKDEIYFATIGEYLDIDRYNNEKAFERSYQEMYDREKYYWKWESADERRSYRSMWISSEQTFNDIRFVVGALILNRVISAINAVRLVSKYNNSLKEETGWNFSVGVRSDHNLPLSLNLNFQKNF